MENRKFTVLEVAEMIEANRVKDISHFSFKMWVKEIVTYAKYNEYYFDMEEQKLLNTHPDQKVYGSRQSSVIENE